MSEYTPGPWVVGGATGLRNQVSIDPCVATAYGAGKEVEANARLMAAAPDLLEALQDLFDADMEHVLMGDGKDDQVEAIAKARAAVAKALGKTTQEPKA
jgi:hypothetical protein